MSERVFITGIGIISSIGRDAGEVFHSLQHKNAGIGKITLLDTSLVDKIPAGEIKATNHELLDMAGWRGRSGISRTALLGIIAARQAAAHARLHDSERYRTGLISATTVGGMDRSEHFYRQYLHNPAQGRLRDVITHDCGDSTEKIADALGVTDYLATISTACSSSANAILQGARLIRNGMLDKVVAGGSDALTLFTLNGFNSLMILDSDYCRPFDAGRKGLNLGEGAAFLVLESERITRKEDERVLCEVKGCGNACDAYHQTASSPEGKGAGLAMLKALEEAGLEPGDIDYINAHGTGTQNNDLSEGIAIERIFHSGVPLCSSTKSFTGHTLGAAGAVEAVISVLALLNQVVYPNLNFTTKMDELGFSPVTGYIKGIELHHVMSNSFGFGGNNTSIILSR